MVEISAAEIPKPGGALELADELLECRVMPWEGDVSLCKGNVQTPWIPPRIQVQFGHERKTATAG